MGSPLGPLLTNIFMTLEGEVIPKITPYLCNWKRYVDNIHAYVNLEKADFILRKLNSYHPNIQFTFELEKNKPITCLDVLVKRTVTNQIETCVHSKETSPDLCINWNSYESVEWKIGTLRNIVKRAKTACFTTILLNQEIEYLKAVFTGISEYSFMTAIRTINQELH